MAFILSKSHLVSERFLLVQVLLQIIVILGFQLSIQGFVLILNPVLIHLPHPSHLLACPESSKVLLYNNGRACLLFPPVSFLLILVLVHVLDSWNGSRFDLLSHVIFHLHVDLLSVFLAAKWEVRLIFDGDFISRIIA